MTPITERLAEAYQKLDAINEIIFAAENAAMACDVVQPTIKMLSDSDIKRIFDLSLHAEYDRLRTHPAKGGEGREPVRCNDPNCEEANRHNIGQVNTCVHFDFKAAYARQLAAAPPPQPVAPAEGGEAKAVACVARGQFGHNLQALVDIDKLADGTMLFATPQPPPAPSALRYRDPTIEDVRLFKEEYRSGLLSQEPEDNIVLKAMQRMGIVLPLNAIGAKVGERP